MGKDRSTVHKNSSNFGVVLIAAMAGAIAGLLFAPKKGSETREDLKAKYNETKNKSQDVAETAREKVTKGVETLRTKAQNSANKAEGDYDPASGKAKSASDRTDDEIKQSTGSNTGRSGHDHAAM